MSSALRSRIRHPKFLEKVHTAQQVAQKLQDDMWLGWSGFTGVGGPKVVPTALADRVEAESLHGQLGFNLVSGASTDAYVESRWARMNLIRRRTPHQVGKEIRKQINETGNIKFFDKHLSMVPQDLTYGFYTRKRTTEQERNSIDIALIEATAITEDGSVILGPAVGATPELVQFAQNVVIEVNTQLPSFEGLHDIYTQPAPPNRLPLEITRVSDRIGCVGLQIDPNKVMAVVESDAKDKVGENSPPDATSEAIAGHLVEFLEHEVSFGRLPENLLPLQSGIGNIANAVIEGLAQSNFEKLDVWTEVFQDSFLDFLENGKLDFASATSIRLTPRGFDRFFNSWDTFSKKILLRPQSVANHPELIRRLGVIAMNTPVEIDIYGHANSTLVDGSRMLNGLGGSGDFLRNAKYSIMHTPSVRPTKSDKTGISCIVPMVSHVDHTEHDLDVFVTEQGLADLRGLAPRERSREVISKCAHPDYKDQLLDYVELAEKHCLKTKSLHEPHVLSKVFNMHLSSEDKDTMKLDTW